VPYDGSQEQSWTRRDGMPHRATWRFWQDLALPVENDAFGRWLQRCLHRELDDTAAEPLPAEWLRLIEGATPGSRES
jgi:hypothetical protein